MNASPRPIGKPINAAAFTAGLFGTAAYVWHGGQGLQSGLYFGALFLATALGAKAVKYAVDGYKLRSDLWNAEHVSTEHGSAREATLDEIINAGLTTPETGMFAGLQRSSGTPIFAGAPWTYVEAPPGAGKTINLVVGEILHRARLAQSLFIADIKGELTPMLARVLSEMGFEVWCIDPAGELDESFNRVELNPYQPVLDAAHATDETRQDAAKFANDLANLHLPEERGGDQKNLYFRIGARRAIAVCILALALFEPGNCTPGDVFKRLNDPTKFQTLLLFLRFEAEKLRPGDPVAAYLASEAGNLLTRKNENPENYSAFLEGATQTLIAFNQSGRLASYGRAATANIAEMRQRQIIAFVVAPLSQQREFAPLVSLLNSGLIEAAKRAPRGHPVHIVGEEYLNYRITDDFASEMETLRGLRVSATLYVQSYEGLVRKVGREAAKSMQAYSDVKLFIGTNELDRARHVSDLIAEETVLQQNWSGDKDARKVGWSGSARAKRLMTADEILAMPKDEAWMFVRGMRPIRLQLTHYGLVAPWQDEVGTNPFAPMSLRGEPMVELAYPKPGSGERIAVRSFVRRSRRASKKKARPWPIRPRDLVWIPALASLWVVAAAFGTPHLRYAYDAIGKGPEQLITRCSYVGLQGFQPPPSGRCDLFSLIRSTAQD